MPSDQNPPKNIDHLLTHLKSDSLAASLVTAYAQADDVNRERAIKNVLSNRLSEIGRGYDQTKNQKN